MLKIGDTLPSGTLMTMGNDGPEAILTHELFAHKKVVLFGVPGAFTSGCSLRHLPGYTSFHQDFLNLGVDIIACVATNDVFVMDHWAEHQNAKGKILMLSDDGSWRDTLNMKADLSSHRLGIRIRRFAAILHNNTIQHISVEKGVGVDLSSAETILNHLKNT